MLVVRAMRRRARVSPQSLGTVRSDRAPRRCPRPSRAEPRHPVVGSCVEAPPVDGVDDDRSEPAWERRPGRGRRLRGATPSSTGRRWPIGDSRPEYEGHPRLSLAVQLARLVSDRSTLRFARASRSDHEEVEMEDQQTPRVTRRGLLVGTIAQRAGSRRSEPTRSTAGGHPRHDDGVTQVGERRRR